MAPMHRSNIEQINARSVRASMLIEHRDSGRAPQPSKSFVKGSAIAAVKSSY